MPVSPSPNRITGWKWSAAEFPVRVDAVVYARHGREPFGSEPVESLYVERLKAEGLAGCSPLYVNPVNMLNILTKVLAEGKGIVVRRCLKEAPLSGINLRAKL